MASLLAAASASAHISYSGRNFGNFTGSNNEAVIITNQSVTGAHGWADGTDADWGDAHKGRFYRFTLLTPGTVTIEAQASDNGGSKLGTLLPAFSLYTGLAHLPLSQPDHDGAPITVAFLDSIPGVQEGAFRALTNWDIGNEDAVPPFDFNTMMTHFVYVGNAADGTAANYGSAPGISGDGVADGYVKRTFDLPAGDYTIFVGGADYNAVDANSYGVEVTVGVGPNPGSGITPQDPGEEGVPYKWTVILNGHDSKELISHVGAWSWEDDSLFAPGEPSVGWTHTSAWTAVKLTDSCRLTVHVDRQTGVPWPSPSDPTRTASIESMFPSFTLWRNWDTDGEQSHTYNNRGNVEWAEDLSFISYVDNSTVASVERSYILPAGDYTIVVGSNSPATDLNRQGFKLTLSTNSIATPVAIRGGEVPGLPGVTFKSLGSPTINDEQQIAFLATLAGPGINSYSAILSDTGATPLAVIVREGQPDLATGSTFTKFYDPVTDNNDNVLFQAKVKTGIGGVTSANETGLWRYSAVSDENKLIAREGFPAPGTDDGARFKSFTSAAIDTSGGAFHAKLIVEGTITRDNDEGVWVFNEAGLATLVARQGKPFVVGTNDVRVVSKLQFLKPQPIVKGAGRSTNACGARVLHLTFDDGTTGIFHIAS